MTTMEFPGSEYRGRVERARALMGEARLDALFVTGDYTAAPNYRYFTGHVPRDYQSNSARPHLFLLTRDGGAAICVHFFSEGPARQCWVKDIHVYTQPFRHTDALALFRTLGVARGRVGVELGLDQRLMMPVADYERLKGELPGVEWVDAAPLLWRLRMIKSAREVESIREADRINGNALRKAFGRARMGMTENQIYELCVHALVEEGSLRPPHTQMTISSSARYRGKGMITPFSGPTDEPLGRGDLVFIDSGAIVNGYWGEFNRMAVMGPPSAEQTRWHDIVRGIVMGFIERILRPGITCEQAMREAFALYDQAGLDPKQYALYSAHPYFHLCHGLGLNSSELPLVRLTDTTVIEPGMVFSVEAYVRGPDMQYGSEEDVVITPNGCDVLSDPDTGLYIIG
jgi:Xaa-Pro aminopeptidase